MCTFKQIYLDKHSEMFIRTLFSQRPTLSLQKILPFPPESPCIFIVNLTTCFDLLYPIMLMSVRYS